MAIRFIDSNLPDKNWFIDLEPEYKSVWVHLILKCNHAGVWNVSIKLLKAFIGGNEDLTEESILKIFGKRIVPFDNDKWFLPGFVTFQYKYGLNPTNRVHKSVIEILNKQDLMGYLRDFDESYIPLIRPINDPSMTKGSVKIESKMSDKTKSKSKTKIKTKDKELKLIKYWNNNICAPVPKVEKITKDRKAKIRIRLAENEFDYETAIRKINESDFLSGRSGDWSATFDWFIGNDKNYIKILEGNYDNKTKSGDGRIGHRAAGSEYSV